MHTETTIAERPRGPFLRARVFGTLRALLTWPDRLANEATAAGAHRPRQGERMPARRLSALQSSPYHSRGDWTTDDILP